MEQIKELSVLVAHDEKVVAKLVCDILALDGHRTFQAGDAQEILGTLKSEDVDLLIVGGNIPGLSVPELVVFVKECTETAPLPVIALSGKIAAVEQFSGFRRRPDYFLATPFDAIDLIEIISKLTGEVHSSKASAQKTPAGQA